MKFRYNRANFGNLIVFLVSGLAGDTQEVKVEKAAEREGYPNVVAVISGSGQVTGPQSTWVLEAGMIDEDMPGYPVEGNYRYVAGPNGIKFFCARAVTGVVKRELITGSNEFSLTGGILIGVSGNIYVDKKEVCRAPFVVNGMVNEREITCLTNIKAVVLHHDLRL